MISSFSKSLVTLKTALIVDSHTHRILAVRLGGDTFTMDGIITMVFVSRHLNLP